MSQKSHPSDEIWKILKEISASNKEMQATNKELQASNKGFDERQKGFDERQKEIQAIQKKTERMIQKIGGRFNQRWGDLVESLVKGKLVKIFQEQNIDISQTQERTTAERETADGKIVKREIDIIVANGTELVAVEVKTSLTRKDVEYFLEVLSSFKEFFPRYKDEILYGAMAYLKAENKSDILAEEKGLFIIRATGDSAHLVNHKNFKPKAFA